VTEHTEEKTVGLTPFGYCSGNPLFQVNSGVPVYEALAMASDLLFLAKSFAEDAAFIRDTDRHAWAAHYFTVMGKAVIDDVVTAVTSKPGRGMYGTSP